MVTVILHRQNRRQLQWLYSKILGLMEGWVLYCMASTSSWGKCRSKTCKHTYWSVFVKVFLPAWIHHFLWNSFSCSLEETCNLWPRSFASDPFPDQRHFSLDKPGWDISCPFPELGNSPHWKVECPMAHTTEYQGSIKCYIFWHNSYLLQSLPLKDS